MRPGVTYSAVCQTDSRLVIPRGEYANLIKSAENVDMHLLVGKVASAVLESAPGRGNYTSHLVRLRDAKGEVAVTFYLMWPEGAARGAYLAAHPGSYWVDFGDFRWGVCSVVCGPGCVSVCRMRGGRVGSFLRSVALCLTAAPDVTAAMRCCAPLCAVRCALLLQLVPHGGLGVGPPRIRLCTSRQGASICVCVCVGGGLGAGWEVAHVNGVFSLTCFAHCSCCC